MFRIVSVCKGGGYRYCRTEPPHPRRNAKGLYPLHRVLVENKIGRLLESWEDVHHRDENKLNDDPNNLEVLTKSEHTKLHRPAIEKEALVCACGNIFYLRPCERRLREKRNKTLSCSRKCGTKYGRKLRRQDRLSRLVS